MVSHFFRFISFKDALTTVGASGPLGSAGTTSAVMTSTGSSTLIASFKFKIFEVLFLKGRRTTRLQKIE